MHDLIDTAIEKTMHDLQLISPDASELLEAWLAPLAPLPINNDVLVRAIASLLTEAEIGHRAVMGTVTIADVGTVPRHHWVELDSGMCLDFRARRWLWHDPRVPHGAFLPDAVDLHDAHRFVNGHYSPTVFLALVGAPMSAFPIPEGLAAILNNDPEILCLPEPQKS